MIRVLWLSVLVCVVQCMPMSKDELEDFSNFLLKTSSLDLHVKTGVDPEDSFDEDEVVSDDAWEESGKFEGDLILNDRQRRLIVENVEGLSRNGLTDGTKRWPNNEVIYFIQKEHFTSGQAQAIQDGIDDLARASCVKFRPYRKGDRDAVVIQGSRRGCFSQVGYQGGYQVLNLSGRHPVGRGCFRHGTVVHELLHSLGFYHMQSSPDRDDYIDVIWSNILQPARHNFRKYNSFSVSDFGVGYDYDSVLHYSRRAFSANGQDTLVPKKSGAEIGQRVGLSDKDTQKLNKMYCDANNDPVQLDDNTTKKPKHKKKKPKNQPFQGHGIGYHQGKTVVIKLPAAQTYKLPNVPSTRVFDFSKTPEVVPPEAEGYRFGKEVTYPSIFSQNTETVMDYQNSYEVKPKLVKNTQVEHQATDEEESSKKNKNIHSSAQHFNDSNEVRPEYVSIDKYDKDLKDAFHRLTNIVKQHVYPQNQGYVHKINKDYSKFYTPLQSKKSDPHQDYFDEKSEQPMSYGSTLTSQKQLDTKHDSVGFDENSNDNTNFENGQLGDRMDISYRTSLPTKKPYSSYEQTETPHYVSLEYLKNRHDFSSVYSPKTLNENVHKDQSLPKIEYNTYKQDININPYEHSFFYTDKVKEGSKGNLTNASKEIKLSQYELDGSTLNKQSGSTNKQLEDKIDSSYRTFFPTKKPFSSDEHTETPRYATLEYLKDRHNISNLDMSRTSKQDPRKEPYTALEDELPPTEGDWLNKDSYKQNPANYDRDLYADHIYQNREGYHKKEYKDRITEVPKYNNANASKYNDDKNNRETPNKSQAKYKAENVEQDFYTSYEMENNRSLTEKKTKDEGKDYGNIYYADYGRKNNAYLTYNPNYDDENVEDATKKTEFMHDPVKYDNDYYTDYEKEHRGISIEASNESDDENSKESPKKSQAFLFDAPVPLTRDWFKPSYIIPEISNEDENSRSNEDHNR